jgi:hypothetical protein
MGVEGGEGALGLLTQLLDSNSLCKTLKCVFEEVVDLGDNEVVGMAELPSDGVNEIISQLMFILEKVIPHRNKLISHYSSLLKGNSRKSEEEVVVDVIRNDYRPFGEHTALIMYVAAADYSKGLDVFKTWTLQDLFERVVWMRNAESKAGYEREVAIWAATAPHSSKAIKPPKTPKLI